jgi:signal transduction histidine kinase
VSQHLFKPFVTTKPQGLGLGLSISSGIIEAHDSMLRVESESGNGATFSFTLPLYRGEMDR